MLACQEGRKSWQGWDSELVSHHTRSSLKFEWHLPCKNPLFDRNFSTSLTGIKIRLLRFLGHSLDLGKILIVLDGIRQGFAFLK